MDSIVVEALREAASLALSALFSFWAARREEESSVICDWAVRREASLLVRVVRRDLVSEASDFWVASSSLREAMRLLAAMI